MCKLIEREREREVQVILCVTLSNVTPPNNLLLNLYFKNRTVELHVLYMLNIHADFYANRMLFTLWYINLSFKVQKLELNN